LLSTAIACGLGGPIEPQPADRSFALASRLMRDLGPHPQPEALDERPRIVDAVHSAGTDALFEPGAQAENIYRCRKVHRLKRPPRLSTATRT